MLTCRWCGQTYPDTNSVDHAADGFWCEACDGFTHFDRDAGSRHRMLLLLEQSGTAEAAVSAGEIPRPKKLRKRVSPLRYPGGKSKLIDYLQAQMLNGFTDTFVEVFAGGASLGLSLLDAGCVRRLVLNDYDPMVYSFWQTCLFDSGELCKRIDERLPTLEDFWQARVLLQRFQRGEAVSTADVAWSFFLLNRTAFSGIITANPMGGKAGGHEGFLSRWNPPVLKQRICRVAELAPCIELHNQDCNAFLEETAYWLPNCTLFVDPPFVSKGAALYHSSFDEVDHRRLAELLGLLHFGMDGPDIIITYDDHPLVRALYPLAEQRVVGRYYSIAN